MMDFLMAKQAAEKWNIFPCRVQILCGHSRIKGAFRLGWAWAIPKDAEKSLLFHSDRGHEIEGKLGTEMEGSFTWISDRCFAVEWQFKICTIEDFRNKYYKFVCDSESYSNN
ncbi:MAG: hypothetical protein PWQ59_409 [Thermoanaerobacterium sp.]|nr:hypothetical protein [Thermoanaerobacterium sp.]MDN5315929.1 hypothetical protein [Thermoanaerobacterium sp.]